MREHVNPRRYLHATDSEETWLRDASASHAVFSRTRSSRLFSRIFILFIREKHKIPGAAKAPFGDAF